MDFAGDLEVGLPRPRSDRATRRRAPWLAVTCAVLGAFGSPGPARGAVWTNVNPGGGGAFTCVAAGPSGILVVGSDISGIYRSDDHGGSWQNVGSTDGGLGKCYISSVAFDNENGWIVHLGTDGGLYRSGNGARTFELVYNGGFFSAITVAPSDPNTIYAAKESAYNTTDPVILKSTDRGGSWTIVGALPAGTRVIKIGVQPANPSRLFALSGYEKLVSSTPPRRALYVSSDGGATWTDAHGDSTNGGMTGNPWDADYDPIHPDTVFATSVVGSGTVENASSWSGNTWRGRQSGGVWTQVSAHTGAIMMRRDTGQISTVDVQRDGPGCSECGVFTSTNAGATWSRVSDMSGWDAGWNGSIAWAYSASISGIGKTLGWDPTNSRVLYWVTPQFVWRSVDGGASFFNMFTNQVTAGFWAGRGINNVAPAALAASGNVLYSGMYDLGIWRSLDSGASWQSSNMAGLTGTWGDKGGNCMTLLTDPARSNIVWASQGATMTSAWVIRSLNSGYPGSWTVTLGVPVGFVTGLALDPTSSGSNRTVYASSNGAVYRSVDDGYDWSLVYNCDSCYVTAASGSTIFTGGQKGLWRSLDGGTTWAELAPATFHLGPSGYDINSAKWNGPRRIVLSGDTVYVAVYGKNRGLYRSVNGGNAWTRLLADDYAIEFKVDAYGALYLCSSSATNAGGVGSSGSTGIRMSRDSGTTWSSLTSGLPWPFAWPIEAVPQGGGTTRLFVGSPGSGVWTTIASPSDPLAAEPIGGATALRLAGFRPNPAREHVSVVFSLGTWEPAVLEVFDVAGRCVVRRDVGSLGPGSHVLPLGPAFRAAPGVYSIRLVQGSHSVRTRSVVLK